MVQQGHAIGRFTTIASLYV